MKAICTVIYHEDITWPFLRNQTPRAPSATTLLHNSLPTPSNSQEPVITVLYLWIHPTPRPNTQTPYNFVLKARRSPSLCTSVTNKVNEVNKHLSFTLSSKFVKIFIVLVYIDELERHSPPKQVTTKIFLGWPPPSFALDGWLDSMEGGENTLLPL